MTLGNKLKLAIIVFFGICGAVAMTVPERDWYHFVYGEMRPCKLLTEGGSKYYFCDTGEVLKY